MAATRLWMTMNHEDRLADAEQKSRTMVAPLLGIPGLQAELIDNVIGYMPYGVQLEVDSAIAGFTAHDVVARLKEGDPPIWTRVRDGETGIQLHAFGLYPGEAEIVGERIAVLFKK